MAKNNNPNGDNFGFDKLTVPELNKVIADLTDKNGALTDQKKDYVSATNEVIRENKKKIDAALAARRTAEQVKADEQHEERVGTFLANTGS
jgi:phosphoglycerol transferase MdoB-like AlkP superfamily enzyme